MEIEMQSQQLLSDADSLISKLAVAESQLEAGWVRVSYLLLEIQKKRCWEPSYKSFSEYMQTLLSKYKIGRAQMYSGIATVRELEGVVTEDDLNKMGISKAKVLADSVKNNPTLPEDAMISALDPKVTVKDLKEILFTAKEQPTAEEGEWLDMEFEFMVTPSERQILESACNAARHGDPTINDKQKPSAQKKDIALKMAMEYLSAHSGDIVEGGKGI